MTHGNANSLGEEVYRNAKMYTNEHLHKVLDDTVRLIAQIQRLCIQNRQAICNVELERLNTNKP